jgi:hypothetical protein
MTNMVPEFRIFLLFLLKFKSWVDDRGDLDRVCDSNSSLSLVISEETTKGVKF